MQHKPFNEITYVPTLFDRYNAFYKPMPKDNYYADFALFETGELRVNLVRPRPHERRFYPELNIEIYGTSDGGRQFTTPDGRPVKKTWLDRDGMQYLLIDYDTNRAVRLVRWSDPEREPFDAQLPVHLQKAGAVIPFQGAFPQGGNIAISVPDKAFMQATAEWRKEVLALANAQLKMRLAAGETLRRTPWYYGPAGQYVPDNALTMEPIEFVAKQDSLDDLDALAAGGFTTFKRETVPYLIMVE